MGILNKLSKVLGPRQKSDFKAAFVSKSQKLLADLCLTHFNDGVGTLMPILVKSLGKLEGIIQKEMRDVGAYKCMLPILTRPELLEISGRVNIPELFKVNTKENKSYFLSPTCEEAITHLLTLYKPFSHKTLPVRLYQISTKFRNERRTKSGLLRSKEFVMKDLYCFDKSEDACEQCYQEIIKQYNNFFDILKVPYMSLEGPTGNIGGIKSQEFFFLADAGEDKLLFCNNCGHIENMNFLKDIMRTNCQKCQGDDVTVKNVIEVGHAFKLGTRFTEPFNATYVDDKKNQHLIQMSCFGLGLTRILAASIEVLCTPEEIRWPLSIAPYLVCIVPPKAGSKEEAAAGDLANHLYHSLNQSLQDDVIIDDQTSLTIGRRFQFNKKLGFPFQVIIGKHICDDPPLVEIFDCSTDSVNLIQFADVNQFILDKLANMAKAQTESKKVSMKN